MCSTGTARRTRLRVWQRRCCSSVFVQTTVELKINTLSRGNDSIYRHAGSVLLVADGHRNPWSANLCLNHSTAQTAFLRSRLSGRPAADLGSATSPTQMHSRCEACFSDYHWLDQPSQTMHHRPDTTDHGQTYFSEGHVLERWQR
jgi:hypothetical protein